MGFKWLFFAHSASFIGHTVQLCSLKRLRVGENQLIFPP